MFLRVIIIILLLFVIYICYQVKEIVDESTKDSKLVKEELPMKISYNDVKIGALVRSTFPKLLKKDLLDQDEVKKLLTDEYSKQKLNLNYPFLKKIDPSKSINENRLEGDYTKYYAQPYIINGEEYLLTSEWYQKNKTFYIYWLEGFKANIGGELFF